MGWRPNQSPSFFKILIGDFAQKLRIPPAFVKNFREKLPENPILKIETGETWVVPIEQIGSGGQHLFFTHKGWHKFVKDLELQVGDFLVFRLISDSTFEVVAYDRTCCVKRFNSSIDCSIGDEPNEHYIENPYMYGSKNRSQKRYHSQADSYAKRSGTVNVAMESDQSEEDQEKFDSVLEQKQLYFSWGVRYSHGYVMPIRKSFAIKTGLMMKKSTMLKNREGRVWPVEIRIRSGRVFFGSGWSDFRSANKIAIGDTCLFKFIPNDGNVIHVQNFRKGKGK